MFLPFPGTKLGQSAENIAENPLLDSKESETNLICISPELADNICSGMSDPVNPWSGCRGAPFSPS